MKFPHVDLECPQPNVENLNYLPTEVTKYIYILPLIFCEEVSICIAVWDNESPRLSRAGVRYVVYYNPHAECLHGCCEQPLSGELTTVERTVSDFD